MSNKDIIWSKCMVNYGTWCINPGYDGKQECKCFKAVVQVLKLWAFTGAYRQTLY